MSKLPRLLIAFLTGLTAAVPAATQSADDDYVRALAAGYEAAFTCSATFNAGRRLADIQANELSRVYAEYRGDIADLTAEISRSGKFVAVQYDEDAPPRIAAWREHLGCAQLPIGGELGTAALPYLPLTASTKAPVGRDPLPRRLDRRYEALVRSAFDGETFGPGNRTSAILIVKNGRIVAERYARGINAATPQRTWSVAKSIAGTVLGVAAHKDIIDIRAPAEVPEWQSRGDPRQRITTEQLMRMASGLTSDFPGNRTDAIYVGGVAVEDNAPGQSLLHRPGTVFRYANNDTLLALYGLRHALGNDREYLAFPFEELTWKLGMTDTVLETDWRGDFIMSSQVWTTARDLARLGLLYLNDGVWQRERLLPRGFVRFVSTPSGPQPDRDWKYGATFWVAGEDTGLPDGTFAAFGNRGQFLVIVPEEDMLIIRRGYDPIGENRGFDITAFSRAVLDAAD
ncbi:MAG: serine hydrolase [Pacificimonas sp.]|jgi:CubicO group peptidase (beta-lactamase class C family)|nr:serine hydrolase [Pacificimonas sp.]